MNLRMVLYSRRWGSEVCPAMASLQMRNTLQCCTPTLSVTEFGCFSSPASSRAPSSAGLESWFPRACHVLRSNGGRSSSSERSTSVSQRRFDVRRHAKFQQFTPADGSTGVSDELPPLGEEPKGDDTLEEDQRADRVLPDNLEGAVLQSSESTALFIQSGGDRALVEILVPDLVNSGEEGDQLKLWGLSRLFLEDLQSRLGAQQLKAVFPDMGVAAMLKYQWKDATFKFASLNDRKPVDIDDEVVVMIQPDYQMLASVEKIASSLSDAIDSPPRPLVMYNPSLQSGEVGIGLNIRRMREFFLGTFNTVYSMRSLSFGAVFRRYPGAWQVFFDDEEVPGRYVLKDESPIRPVLEDVEMMFLTRGKGKDGEGADQEPGPLQNLVGVLSSMGRFMQSLSR